MNDTPQLRNFGQVLQSLEDGQLIADLTDKLQELNGKLARQAEARGKAKGEIVLKLKLLADEGGTVQIDGEIVCKEPKAARARSVLWLTKENTLAGSNPKQMSLPVRDVSAGVPAAAVRSI